MLLNNKRFELFFNTYYEPVYLFSLKYVREEPVAQDIAQNVFVRLYEKRENFYAIEKAKSFAYTTAHNLCLNHLRHSQIAQKYISQREGGRRAKLSSRNYLSGNTPFTQFRHQPIAPANPGNYSARFGGQQ